MFRSLEKRQTPLIDKETPLQESEGVFFSKSRAKINKVIDKKGCGVKTMDEVLTKPVRAQLEAYNAQDVDLFLAQYHEDVQIKTIDGELLAEGTGQMRERYTKLFAENPNNRAEVTERWVVGKHVFDQEVVTGREGQTEPVHVVAIYQVENELIRL